MYPGDAYLLGFLTYLFSLITSKYTVFIKYTETLGGITKFCYQLPKSNCYRESPRDNAQIISNQNILYSFSFSMLFFCSLFVGLY
jgi:hypothetical protein